MLVLAATGRCQPLPKASSSSCADQRLLWLLCLLLALRCIAPHRTWPVLDVESYAVHPQTTQALLAGAHHAAGGLAPAGWRCRCGQWQGRGAATQQQLAGFMQPTSANV